MLICHYFDRILRILVTHNFLYNIYDHEKILFVWTILYTYTIINKYYPGLEIGLLPPKQGGGKLPLFYGDREWVIPIYGLMYAKFLRSQVCEPERKVRKGGIGGEKCFVQFVMNQYLYTSLYFMLYL